MPDPIRFVGEEWDVDGKHVSAVEDAARRAAGADLRAAAKEWERVLQIVFPSHGELSPELRLVRAVLVANRVYGYTKIPWKSGLPKITEKKLVARAKKIRRAVAMIQALLAA